MYHGLAKANLIQELEKRDAVFMGWHKSKKSDKVASYFKKYGLTPGYFTGGQQPWANMNDDNTRVASAATVIDLRSGKIIYSSGRKAAHAASILNAIDMAK